MTAITTLGIVMSVMKNTLIFIIGSFIPVPLLNGQHFSDSFRTCQFWILQGTQVDELTLWRDYGEVILSIVYIYSII